MVARSLRGAGGGARHVHNSPRLDCQQGVGAHDGNGRALEGAGLGPELVARVSGQNNCFACAGSFIVCDCLRTPKTSTNQWDELGRRWLDKALLSD